MPPTPEPEATATASVCADFAAHPELVRSTHLFFSDLSQRMLCDVEAAESVSMVLAELLENLSKYGRGPASSIEVAFDCTSDHRRVRIRTANEATPERLEGLRKLLDEMRAWPDPIECYDHVIRSSVGREGSGLGLARIRAETTMQLSFSFSGSEITIQAESSPTGRIPC